MTSSARAELFATLHELRRVAASAERIRLDLQALGTAPAPAPSAPELCQAFLVNVIRNRGTVDCAATRSDAVKAIGQYLYTHFRSHRLVAGHDPRLAAMPWRDAGVLPRFGSLEDGEPVALSFARLGVAETGAVVTWTGKANPAANNLLPEHHLVLVDSADIVFTLEQAWERLNADMDTHGRPRGINFIAGPSSTADIDGVLVYGAHGPRHWHVIVMGKVPPNTLELARAAAAA